MEIVWPIGYFFRKMHIGNIINDIQSTKETYTAMFRNEIRKWNFAFAGSIGTAGRACNKTSKGIDGCDLLCCGRGYDTRRVLTTQPCNCTFRWCCAVECKTCTQWKDEHYCKPLQSFEVNKIRP